MRMSGDRKETPHRTRLPCTLVIRDSVRANRATATRERRIEGALDPATLPATNS
jgi:hypothetical protein